MSAYAGSPGKRRRAEDFSPCSNISLDSPPLDSASKTAPVIRIHNLMSELLQTKRSLSVSKEQAFKLFLNLEPGTTGLAPGYACPVCDDLLGYCNCTEIGDALANMLPSIEEVEAWYSGKTTVARMNGWTSKLTLQLQRHKASLERSARLVQRRTSTERERTGTARKLDFAESRRTEEQEQCPPHQKVTRPRQATALTADTRHPLRRTFAWTVAS